MYTYLHMYACVCAHSKVHPLQVLPSTGTAPRQRTLLHPQKRAPALPQSTTLAVSLRQPPGSLSSPQHTFLKVSKVVTSKVSRVSNE